MLLSLRRLLRVMERSLCACAALATSSCADDAPSDGGIPDARVSDSATGPDAGSSDAGSSDAGSSDAGSSDAGSSDAGSSDAGSSDAGSSDATVNGSCGLLSPFDEGIVYERTIHVAIGGSDSASGASDAPLATLDEALARVTPSTRVVVHDGTYQPPTKNIDVAGEPGRPIAFVADGDVTIDSTGRQSAFRVSRTRYIVLDGFNVIGRSTAPINIDDGGVLDMPTEYVVVRNFTISGAIRYCIKLAGVDHFWILNNDVSDCGQDDGIDVVGGHDGVIAWNDIHDMPGPDSISGIQIKMGSADVVVVGNTITNVYDRSLNMGGGGIQTLYRPPGTPYEAIRITAIGNVIEPPVGRGIGMAFAGCVDCVFANNTIIRPSTWVGRVLPGGRSAPSNGRFVNNLIVLNVDDLAGGTAVNVGPVDASTFEFDNNIWQALDRPAGWAGPVFAGGLSPGTGSIIQQDPRLTDLAGGDYRPTAQSPALGAGQDIGIDLPDHDGRCFSTPPTIGAFAGP